MSASPAGSATSRPCYIQCQIKLCQSTSVLSLAAIHCMSLYCLGTAAQKDTTHENETGMRRWSAESSTRRTCRDGPVHKVGDARLLPPGSMGWCLLEPGHHTTPSPTSGYGMDLCWRREVGMSPAPAPSTSHTEWQGQDAITLLSPPPFW